MPRVIATLTVLVTVALVAVGLTGARDDAPLGPVLLVAFLTPACVGLFVALRRPGNVVAWILQLGALSVSVVMLASVVASAQGETTLGLWAATVAAPWPVLFLWPLALAFVFPDGALPSRRWRPIAWAVFANSMLIVILLIFGPTHLIDDREVPTPLPVQLPAGLEPLFWACWGGLLASLFAGALALRARYRA